MLKRIISLIWKELIGVWRDPQSRMAILVPPIIQLFIFAFAATLDVKNVPIGIVNRDNGKESIELLQRFHGSPTFSHIVYLDGIQEIAPFIDQQKGVIVVSIDEQFSRNLNAKKPAPVQLILDGRKSNTAQIVAGYTGIIIDQFNRDFAADMDIKQQNTQLFPRNWFNPNLLYYWYNVPSLVAILSMLVGLVITSLSIARERELGTFDQLLVSPLLPIEIVIGKMVPGIIIGFLEACFIMVIGIYVFKVPFTGLTIPFLFSLLIFISCIVGVGLFISSVSQTQQQAILGTFVFMVPSVLLSGFATPIENMPEWLQPVTYLIPLKYMLIISKGTFLKAMPVKIILNNVWPMVLIAIFTLTASGLFFRRRLG